MALPTPTPGARGTAGHAPRARVGALAARSPRAGPAPPHAIGSPGRRGRGRGGAIAPRRAAPPTCGGASTHPARSRRVNQRGAICCPPAAGGGCPRPSRPPRAAPAHCWGAGGGSSSAGLRQHRRSRSAGPRCVAEPAAAKVLPRLAWPRLASRRGGAPVRLGLERAAAPRASPPSAGAGGAAARPSPPRHAAGAHHEAGPGENRPGVRRALLARHRLLLPGQLLGGGGGGLRAGASEADAPRRGTGRRAAGRPQPRRRQAAPPRRPDQVDRRHGGGLRGHQLSPHADRPAGDVLREPARQVLRERAIQGKGPRGPDLLSPRGTGSQPARPASQLPLGPARNFALALARGASALSGVPAGARGSGSPAGLSPAGGGAVPACGTPVTAAALQPSPQGAGSLAPPVPAALRAGFSPLPCCVFSGLFGCRTPSGPLPFHQVTPAVTSAGGSSLLAVGWSRLRPASGCAHRRCRQGGPVRGVPHRKRLTLTTFRGGASSPFSPCERTYPALI